LAVQVRLFDEIAVDQTQPPDAGAREHFSMQRSERATANDHRATLRQPLLSFFADAGEKSLAGITFGIHLGIADWGFRVGGEKLEGGSIRQPQARIISRVARLQ